MTIAHLSTNILANTALIALRNAYEECSDKSAKESIFLASIAVTQLHSDLVKFYGTKMFAENDSDFDPSEYCAAV